MKHVFRYGIIALALFLSSFVSLDEVVSAIKNGNAAELSKFFDNTVDLTFPGKTSTYSKSQAELVIKDFFNTNIVKGFEMMQKGDNEGSKYVIGLLHTNNGEFKTTIFLKRKADKELLQELRFEK